MKKSLLALAAIGLFAGAAQAQSTVTLWGIVDLSLQQIKNGKVSEKRMGTDGINSSRLGFRGVEDLGGGMRAAFHLEAGMANDVGAVGGSNGIATVMFNRRSTVSLLGGFGEVRLGRDYNPSFWNTTIFDPFGTNGIGSSLNVASTLGSGAATLVRSNNSIGYFLPGGLGGLYGQVQVSPAEGVTGQGYRGFRVGYGAGPVDVAFGYGATKTATADKFVLTDLGGSFDLGVAKLQAQWISAKFGARKQVNYLLGAVVPMGQAELHATYVKANQSGAGTDANDASQIALGGVYNLSKRSALYATYSRISNKGTQSFAVGPTSSVSGLAGNSSSGIEFGVRHSF